MRLVKTLLACMCLALCLPALADKFDETTENFRKAEFSKPYFESAYGYAVFATIGKGAVGVGGGGGTGRVYAGGRYVGDSKMVQLSFGLQMGGQVYSQIVFFKDKASFDEFTGKSFEFSADASAVAVTVGANAEAGTKGISVSASTDVSNGKAAAEYHKGMAVLTLAKGGLMYQAAVAGQKYTFKNANQPEPVAAK